MFPRYPSSLREFLIIFTIAVMVLLALTALAPLLVSGAEKVLCTFSAPLTEMFSEHALKKAHVLRMPTASSSNALIERA